MVSGSFLYSIKKANSHAAATADIYRDPPPHRGPATGTIRARSLSVMVPCSGMTLTGALRYWITSSAVANSVSGMVRPSALAVLTLMASSNLVGSRTGKSAGFSPFRTRPV